MSTKNIVSYGELSSNENDYLNPTRKKIPYETFHMMKSRDHT